MTETVRPAWRRALLPLALSAAGVAATPQASAQLMKSHNSNAPVNYSADRIEMQDRDNRIVLTGNVDITQEDLRLRAARVTVNYTNNGSLKIQRMIANGGVYVTRGTQSARGDAGVYDLVQRIITMAGNVSLNRNGDTLYGGRLVMNLDTGISTVDGKSSAPSPITSSTKGGRVSGTFSVDTKNSDTKSSGAKGAPAKGSSSTGAGTTATPGK